MNTGKFKNAVKNEDGSVRSFVVTVAGEDFYCSCGCNCFHKPNRDEPKVYKCNGCGTKYGPKK